MKQMTDGLSEPRQQVAPSFDRVNSEETKYSWRHLLGVGKTARYSDRLGAICWVWGPKAPWRHLSGFLESPSAICPASSGERESDVDFDDVLV